MGIRLLIIFAIAFCVFQFPTLTHSVCSDNEICGNCVTGGDSGGENCGWCADEGVQACRNSSQQDSCSNFIRLPEQCPIPVYNCESMFDDCITCSSFEECGWCSSTGKCTSGDSTGPKNGTCEKWQYQFTECTGGPVDCSSIQDCFVCTNSDTCGWCGESQRCMRGYNGGPVEQTCSDASWTFYPFQCEPFIAPEFHKSPCDERFSCEKCNQEPGCGWCQDSQKCLPGNEKNPLIGSCKDWKVSCGNRPPSLKDCGDETSCGACTTNLYNCSWCEDTGKCRLGRYISNCTNVIENKEQCPIPAKKGSKWWIGLIVVICIALVGLGGFYIYKTRFSGPKPPDRKSVV